IPANLSGAVSNEDAAAPDPQTEQKLLSRERKQFLAWSRHRVRHVYKEEILVGEFSPQQLQGLVYLEALNGLRVKQDLLTNVQLKLLYEANKKALFSHFGFATLNEWLDSRIGEEKQSGAFVQLKVLASRIIPWCEANEIAVNGQAANVDFFTSKIEGKNMTTRARRAVAPLLQVIENSPNMTLEKRQETVAEILGYVANPLITQKFLDKSLATAANGGVSPFEAVAEMRADGAFDLASVGLSRAQLNW